MDGFLVGMVVGFGGVLGVVGVRVKLRKVWLVYIKRRKETKSTVRKRLKGCVDLGQPELRGAFLQPLSLFQSVGLSAPPRCS